MPKMFASIAVLGVVLVAAHAGQPRDVDGLRDLPLASSSVFLPVYLDTSAGLRWSASNENLSVTIPAQVPGDLISDLNAAVVINDPLYELNWYPMGMQTTPPWEMGRWNYSASFPCPSAWQNLADEVLLVFEGIKMAADLYLNGVNLGYAADQFVRYSFPVKSLLKLDGNSENIMVLSFTTAEDPRNQEARWTASSAGWDWAPYSNTVSLNNNSFAEDGGSRTLSKGIVKSLYLIAIEKANPVVMTYLVPQVFYKGAYPTSIMSNGNGPFEVEVRVYLSSFAGASGVLSVSGNWSSQAQASAQITIPPNSTNLMFSLTLPASNVDLWWPAGLAGYDQTLYQVTASFTAEGGQNTIEDARNIGFRVFALVTADDSNPALLTNSTASGNLTMRFKVNGANIWARGANLIPLDSFEGRFDAIAYRQLALSAVEAGMNVFRVWGGGIFPPESFYSTCDELGLMMYHDAMFAAQDGHVPASPNGSVTQEMELRHNFRRMGHHPSLVVYDACNECYNISGTVYESFVVPIIAQELPAVAPWPSCPSSGWDAGVDTLYGLPIRYPNGSMAALRARIVPENGSLTETHGPYQHGSGFGNYSSVNGGGVGYQPFEPLIPVNFTAVNVTAPPILFGPNQPGIFASEFGAVSFSSFESVTPTLDPAHWGLHGGEPIPWCSGSWQQTCIGNVMAQRNYLVDSMIAAYAGEAFMESIINRTGVFEFQRQLYLSQLASALQIKGDISARRATNELGTIVWQLSEVWPTGGWGSLEYPTSNDDSATAGQVRGGRWKPLHYFYQDFLYQDLFVSCGVDGRCIFKNDSPLPLPAGQDKLSINISAIKIINGFTTLISSQPLPYPLPLGAGYGQWFCVDGSQPPSCQLSLQGALETVDCSSADCLLKVEVVSSGGSGGRSEVPLFSNIELAVPPSGLVLPENITVTAKVAPQPSPDGKTIDISVTAVDGASGKAGSALFVTLTTLAQGRFSTNAFHLFPPNSSTTIQFIGFEAELPIDVDLLTSSLRVEHLGAYLQAP